MLDADVGSECKVRAPVARAALFLGENAYRLRSRPSAVLPNVVIVRMVMSPPRRRHHDCVVCDEAKSQRPARAV